MKEDIEVQKIRDWAKTKPQHIQDAVERIIEAAEVEMTISDIEKMLEGM